MTTLAQAANPDPKWLRTARQYIGAAEIPGRETAPFISGMLQRLGAWWSDDEAPWCGTFVGFCLREQGLDIPRHWYRARAYLDWGVPLNAPALGAVVVYERGAGGHVGFVVGVDQSGRILTLGGNQGNRVSVAPFPRSRVLGFRYPYAAAGLPAAPLIHSTAAASTLEA